MTESGQLIQVAPLLLFIMPSTTMVIRDILSSTDSMADASDLEKELEKEAIVMDDTIIHLAKFIWYPHWLRFMFGLDVKTCTSYRCNNN